MGYKRKRALICCKTKENEVVKRCDEEDILLIAIGFQVIPKEVWDETYKDSKYKLGTPIIGLFGLIPLSSIKFLTNSSS